MKLFAQITKVDEAKRLVIGRAVQEVPDRSDEIFDYATSKVHFEDWSKSFSDDTDGKSLGNLRAMHGKVAAGKLTGIDFHDTDKAIDISAKVVDDNEWAKVLEGVYTGFSIGGSYVGERVTEKIDGKDIKRYTAKPSEISLVDSPCIPTAKFFEVRKADGAVEKVSFRPPSLEVTGTDEQVAEFAKVVQESGKGMGDVIEILKTAFAAKPAPEKTEVEKAIDSAMQMGMLRKKLADPDLPFAEFIAIAKAELSDEEFAAMKGGDTAPIIKQIIEKAGARHSKVDAAHLQEAHDHLTGMGASCGKEAATATAGLEKVVAGLVEKVTNLEKQPMPHVVTLRAVQKSETQTGAVIDEVTKLPYEKLIKLADGSIDWKSSERLLEQGAA